jgi:thiamine-monophosphate kinase
VPVGQALLRSGARPGDRVWVSGTLGDARLALEVFRGHAALAVEDFEAVRRAMECPEPRIALGLALRGLATSAIDLSDGLLGDLGHVLQRSGVGAELELPALPRSTVLAAQPRTMQHECLLRGGDDYELLFTAPPEHDDAVRLAGERAGVSVTPIGRVRAEPGLDVRDEDGQARAMPARGFDHFA